MSRFCSGCGTPLEEGARFCAACGRPAAPAAQPQQPAQQVQSPAQSYAPQQTPQQPVQQPAQPQYGYTPNTYAPGQTAQQPMQQAYGAPQPYAAPPKSKKKLIIILSIVGVLLIVGVILLVVLLGGGKGGTSSPEAIVNAVADTYNSASIDRESVAALTYEYNFTRDEAEKQERIDEIDADSHKWLTENYGEDARVSMTISESQSATQESLNKVKSQLAEKYDNTDKIDEIRKVSVTITVTSSGKSEEEHGSYTLIHADGKWYVLAKSYRYDLEYDD